MDVIIIGAGGHGRDCHQLIDDLHTDGSGRDLHLMGYVDDDPALRGTEVQGLPVLGGLEWLAGRDVAGVMGIGYPKPRYAAQQRASALGVTQWPTLVHPTAYVASRAVLGEGVHVAPFAHIGANARVGAWSIMNVGCVAGHDSMIGNHVLVAGNVTIGGGSRVGDGVLLGLGATLTPLSVVGEWSRVGANSVVLPGYEVPPYAQVIGAPATATPARMARQPQ